MDCLTNAITNTTLIVSEGVIYVARQLGWRSAAELKEERDRIGMYMYCYEVSTHRSRR
jgi:hypothetical protein